MAWGTMQYRSSRPLQEVLRGRLRELTSTHVRYGYRPLTVLLRSEGWMLNAKRIYRLYDEENLKVRSVERKRIARRQRVSQQPATGPNQCWAADFVTDKFSNGRSFRILTVISFHFQRDRWPRHGRLRSPSRLCAAFRPLTRQGLNCDPRRPNNPIVRGEGEKENKLVRQRTS
jgi:transposase InsO family protein